MPLFDTCHERWNMRFTFNIKQTLHCWEQCLILKICPIGVLVNPRTLKTIIHKKVTDHTIILHLVQCSKIITLELCIYHRMSPRMKAGSSRNMPISIFQLTSHSKVNRKWRHDPPLSVTETFISATNLRMLTVI